MSWKMFYRCACDANFIFRNLVKLDRTSAVVSVVNDQLANHNARFIQVML